MVVQRVRLPSSRLCFCQNDCRSSKEQRIDKRGGDWMPTSISSESHTKRAHTSHSVPVAWLFVQIVFEFTRPTIDARTRKLRVPQAFKNFPGLPSDHLWSSCLGHLADAGCGLIQFIQIYIRLQAHQEKHQTIRERSLVLDMFSGKQDGLTDHRGQPSIHLMGFRNAFKCCNYTTSTALSALCSSSMPYWKSTIPPLWLDHPVNVVFTKKPASSKLDGSDVSGGRHD